MFQKYKEYVRQWSQNTDEECSPLSYEEWQKTCYYAEEPDLSEWFFLKERYQELYDIGKRIEEIRKLLFKNRAHRNFLEDSKELSTFDDKLYHIQSEILCTDLEIPFWLATLTDEIRTKERKE